MMAGEFAPDELRQVAHFKRLTELWEGDPEFRSSARKEPHARDRLLTERGVALRSDDISPFWRLLDSEATHPEERERADRDWQEHPVGMLSNRWSRETRDRLLRASKDRASTGIPRFDAWRRRQIARTKNEAYMPVIRDYYPPLFAFELSKGCSKGCWFCSFSRLSSISPP